MKIFFSTLIFSLVCQIGYADEEISSCDINESGHYYAGLIGGLNFGSNNKYFDPSTSVLGGIVIGYQFESNLRLEGELNYSRIQLKNYSCNESSIPQGLPGYVFAHKIKYNIQSVNLLGNILYELPSYKSVSPYFGVGCGYGWRKSQCHNHYFKVHSARSTANKFVWQSIVGAAYPLCDYKIAIDYRRLDFSCASSENLVTCSLVKIF